MSRFGRSMFPYLISAALLGAVVWSVSFSALPPADFTFVNGTEVESIDPARVTGTPEGRIITALFEGLYRPDPNTTKPLPGMALSHDMSADSRVYTFHLRHDAVWSDGTAVTAEDFRWSWQRMLHPETGSEYALLLGECVVGANKYHLGEVEVGDRVEVELADRRNELEPFPRGTMFLGKLLAIDKPPEPKAPAKESSDDKEKRIGKWKRTWTHTVEIQGQERRFCQELDKDKAITKERAMRSRRPIEKCAQVLLDFQQVGIKAPDKYTLEVTLMSPTPYFLFLAEFFPLFPVQRACIERYGYPDWTKQENIVVNGPYRLEFRRFRDRFRLRKNPTYWDAKHVNIEVADAVAVESAATGLNMYLDDQLEWTQSPPSAIIPKLKERKEKDYLAQASLAIYFYRINVTRKPLDNVLVRRALNQAIDKRTLCEKLLRAGQLPSRSFVPPGLDGYTPAQCGEYNVKEAQRLLAEAGYPGGQGLKPIEILYNSAGDQEQIAQAIGGNWEKNLGIRFTSRGIEWASYLAANEQLDYTVARSGWTGDYPDPNTFLGLYVSTCEQNETGWGNPRYDKLIQASARESDPQRRMQLFHDAEQILMEELPVIPIYSYVSTNMVKPYVRGFYSNAQDLHPLRDISIDAAARRQYFATKGRP